MKTIGRHLIAEYYDCAPALLDDSEAVRRMLLEAARMIGAHRALNGENGTYSESLRGRTALVLKLQCHDAHYRAH